MANEIKQQFADKTKTLIELIKARKKTELQRPQEISEEQKKENVIKWVTFFRRNWNLYAELWLHIKLHPFQHIMLYMIGISQVWFAICSRGLSKSFIVALSAMIKALLYPYSEIHITAKTLDQAKKMVNDKMKRELCNKLSPVLKYYYENGLIKFTITKEEIKVDFLMNGSTIWVDVADDSSRGGRATMLIYEECRLLKKTIIDSVFEKMAHPRQAEFLQNPKYAGDSRWIEECQSVYITSAKFKNEWFWRTFKTVVEESFTNKRIPYNFFMGDIYLSILFGLKTKSDYYKAIKQSGELDFEMEDLNIMIGEAEDAFFTRDDFQKNQVIKTAFIMPLPKDIIGHKKLKNRPKRPNEYRILFIDYAFANTTGKSENDNTIIGCMYGIYEDKIMKRGVEYLTTHEASDTLGTANLIRKLFWLYHCDYIVLDLRNGGEIHYNLLTQQYDDLGYPNWNYHGFTVVNDDSLNVVPRNKIDDLISRTIDPQAIPCIIPIVATADFNSLMWLEMKKQLQNENVSFLIDDMEYEQLLNTRNDYFKLTSEEKANLKYPYAQTMLLINEAVNLSQEWKDGRVKLEEPRTGTKDRIVACAYGNYFLTLLENKLAQKEQSKDIDIDWDNISLVV